MQGLSQITPPKVIKRGHLAQRVQWDGNPTTFEVYELKIKSHYYQVGAGYLFLDNFQQAYQLEGVACQTKFSHLVSSQAQLMDDSQHLYGALLGSATDGAIGQFLLKHSSPPDGLSVWIDICASQKINGSQEVKIDSLEKIVNTPFVSTYKGGLIQYVQDIANSFAKLEQLGVNTFKDDYDKRRNY